MSDRDTSTPSVRNGLPAHLMQMHPGRVEIEVEMKVDIDVEFAGKLENAGDLIVRPGVGVGTTADQSGATPAGFHQKRVRARIVQQPFLRKHADFKINRPGIMIFQLFDRLEAAQSDPRIDLHMRAHPRRPLQDRLFERPARTRIDIVFGESALGGGDSGNGGVKRAGLCTAAVENARLVQMDMGFDKSRQDEPAADLFTLCRVRQLPFNRGNPSALDADVRGGQFLAPGDAALAQNKIE